MSSAADPAETGITASPPAPLPSVGEDVHAHRPYVPDDVHLPEFTKSAVLVGAVLGVIFGASSLYLVLKVGMTVSASIPVAVLSITLFRWLARAFGFRKANILENNIVQTTGSAGESIAFGVGVTMPALMLIGFEMHWSRVLVVALLGGVLGILMMIPLRRAFIVRLHGRPGEPGKLLYPEGTACAQVLISGDQGGASGQTVFIGFGLAFFQKMLTEGLNLLTTTVILPLRLGTGDAFSRVARLTAEMAPELLGVGYIIGPRTASIMMAGAVLGGLVLAPTVALSGPGSLTIEEIYRDYLRYIGAGCVAAAGIISMGRTLPMIVRSFASGLSSLRGGADASHSMRRTEDDMSPRIVLGGNLVLLFLLALFLLQEVGPISAVLGAILVVVFGFLFVTVSSRLTGEIGSSSNPISGMTVATLLLTCVIFLALGMTSPTDAVLALSIGGVVCIAASNGGTTSQDLKTGFLVGATPRLQQWAIVVGALTSAVVIGGTLLLFNSVGTIYSQRNLPPVNLKDTLGTLNETEEYQGETFHVWRPSKVEELPSTLAPGQNVKVKPGKYLVDARGQVVYQVDPTITGEMDRRDKFVPVEGAAAEVTLTPDERQRIKHTVAFRDSKTGLLSYDKLWHNVEPTEAELGDAKKLAAREPYRAELEAGEYVVDGAGRVIYKNEGTRVPMKFRAPKTQVMGIIINGLLNMNLNWGLVLIGAAIAITLELCGISSLAFAVGVYIPMQYSTPIFLGGLVRWSVDAWQARRIRRESAALDAAGHAEAEVRALAESESSPAMLLSSGLIAGGSLAGVLIAFLNFVPPVQHALNFGPSLTRLFGGEGDSPTTPQEIIAFTVFSVLIAVLVLVGLGKLFRTTPAPHDDSTANS